jgi:hypothetical protein
MGGTVSRHLTCDVTHLIASSASNTSEKYKVRPFTRVLTQVAVRLSIPVMAPAWVDACFALFEPARRLSPDDADNVRRNPRSG